MGTRPKKPITFWCEHGSHEVTDVVLTQNRRDGDVQSIDQACNSNAPRYTRGTSTDSRQFEIIGLGRLGHADQRPLRLGRVLVPIEGIHHEPA